MKVKSQDLIVELRASASCELLSHSEAVAAGLVFVCCDLSAETFVERDCEVELPPGVRTLVAMQHEDGCNLYYEP
jgi:hypothetical protein